MSDLIDAPLFGENAPEFTVSEISGAIKRVIEGEFGRVRVRGEVGRVFRARSGHLYFDIKDDRCVLASVTWKGQVGALSALPEEGMEVVATGKLTTFGSQSKYQLNVEDLRPAGVGALMAMLEKRKKALEAEGLFAAERKRPLPFLPEVIGVVTSPSGAVIRDILHRLRDRFPRKVLVWPVAVQGQSCAAEVARAIEGFNRLTPGGALPRPDLLIVARGGGSIEDLWGFNEEVVARAAAASEIPLISAVGHETDTTLIDYVSDHRAPTPTAAAELAVPVRMELLAWTDQQGARLTRAMTQGLSLRGQRLRDLSRALPRPESLLDPARQRLDWLDARLPAALKALAQTRRGRLTELAAVLRPATLRSRVTAENQRLHHLPPRLDAALARTRRQSQDSFAKCAARLSPLPIRREIDRKRKELDKLSARLTPCYESRIRTARDRLDGLERLRVTLGYEATLQRGYAVVWSGDHVLTTKGAAEQAPALEIQFRDGRLALGKTQKKRKPSDPSPEQGSLL
ncbi:exodeoxyribonuclease VII large subunit [Tranquillimonas alkanivorans]|uniref:Exodeoxyribonuclease 7 large subunit n=1 Tax=Tranquillimonas alkanivorans TaxID=441119 RepID=A0A1I5KMK5_9RHOB|nr:exodeoxyribonuclease VII large subunit [Tranquillimonas alkanivorans]SFO85916.1 Exodeoxyribonuclease VII large subunit [Tranquillimonas alkanivorans]